MKEYKSPELMVSSLNANDIVALSLDYVAEGDGAFFDWND